MNTRKLNRTETSLLLLFEDCQVNKSSFVDVRYVSEEELAIVQKWNDEGFVKFGLYKNFPNPVRYYCYLSDEAWVIAGEARKNRARKIWRYNNWEALCVVACETIDSTPQEKQQVG